MNKPPLPAAFPAVAEGQNVTVCASCRLHFGMFSFGHANRPQFGGVGLMVRPPNVEVAISSAETFRPLGAHTERVRQFVERLSRCWQLDHGPNCCIDVSSPPDHIGLGIGTQLGLAVAAGLRRFLRLPEISTAALALDVGRGGRSSVGTYGFQQGGLIVDAGKEPGDGLGRLARRLLVPPTWRIVLVRPPNTQGLAGGVEAEAFAKLPPVPDDLTRELWRITNEQMMPAIELGDCAQFGDAVYRFGRLAGECFSPVQGGPFASTRTGAIVTRIRESGVDGVGQSSWGPTVFAIVENDAAAEALIEELKRCETCVECEFMTSLPASSGATIN